MKVLIVNPILSTIEKRGGQHVQAPLSTTMIHTLCMGFVNAGHETTLATASDFRPTAHNNDDYPYKTLFFKGNLKSIALPDRIPLSIEFFRYLKKKHMDYDLIIVSEIFQFYSLAAAIAAPSKTIIWQEMNCHQRILLKMPSLFWHNIVVPLAFRKISGIVPRSESARQFISRYHPRVSTIHVDNCVNSSVFKPSPLKRRQVISSSQLIKRKGIDDIIKVFAEFHTLPGYEDIELVIAGGGEEEKSLRALAKEFGIENAVRFTGYLDKEELAEEIAQSIAFLVHTHKDLNMVSITESLCACTPVLTNTIPASANFINQHGLGIVKDNWTATDLKTMIDTYDTLNKRCLAVRSMLTNTACARSLIDLFNSFQ